MVEGGIKIIMEQMIGTKAYGYTKQSKTHFLDKGLSPVQLLQEPVSSKGYSDSIINDIYRQANREAKKLFGPFAAILCDYLVVPTLNKMKE